MTDDHGLHVEVRDSEIVVTLPQTRFAVTYYRLPNDPQLYLDVRSLPTQQVRNVDDGGGDSGGSLAACAP